MNKDLPPHAKQEVSAQQKQYLNNKNYYNYCTINYVSPYQTVVYAEHVAFKKILNNIALTAFFLYEQPFIVIHTIGVFSSDFCFQTFFGLDKGPVVRCPN